ncbi:MAG: DUF2959 domain-containing protein [Wenzhouxiangellaceae bacterium]
MLYRCFIPCGLIAALMLGGCQSMVYKAWETVGVEKRELLVDRVEDARDAQAKAGEQFQTTLERFRSVVNFDGGDLEKLYDRLNREYQRSVDRAEQVKARIDAVEDVADALFSEWERELDEYQSANLRRQSRRMLDRTRARYHEMLAAMRRAERSIPPVLEAFQDQVLFLKHNLNARAVAAIRNELVTIERETADLLAAMQQSIAEADRFIQTLKDEQGSSG